MLSFFSEAFPLSLSASIIDEIKGNKTDFILDKSLFLRYNDGTVYEKERQAIPRRNVIMPKSTGQKLRILYLMEILKKKTDESHALTTAELIHALSLKGINADRKTV